MRWTCSSCGETDLGYNICWTCKTPRPGSKPNADKPGVDMLVTTTTSFETHTISTYLGPVFGETIYGANVIRDFFAATSQPGIARVSDFRVYASII